MGRKNIAVMSAALVLAGALGAEVINVPANQPTIQAGIETSGDGDTVLVARGRYFENVNFRGKRVVLASGFLFSGNPDDIDSTIIDGGQSPSPDTASCILILRPSAADSADTAAALIGFTLTNGRGTVWADKYVPGTSNVEGGGLLIENCSPRIRHNRICGNTAVIRGSCFDGAGGGIKVTDGRPEISNNLIVLNHASDHAGGVLLWHSGGKLYNNIVAWNRSGGNWGGGGGLCIDQCQGRGVILANNSIALNRGGPGNGGGLHIWNSNPLIENCIIWGNQSQQIYNEGGSLSVMYCDVQGGFTGIGNIDSDPLWADDLLYLGMGSPCIDAGNDSAAYNDPEDGSSPGQALWPSMGALRNDMGAYGGPGRSPLGQMPPHIAGTYPYDRQNRVDYDASLWVAFSRSMDTSSLSLSFSDPGVLLSWSWSSGHDTLYLSHSQSFSNFTTYRLKVTAGQSVSGEALMPLPDSISFRTLDTVRPRLASTQPADGQSGVATNAIIRLWFTKPVNKNTLTYSFSDTSYHFTVYQTNDSVITLGHVGHLFAAGTTYTLELTAFQDTAGNSMGQPLVPNPFSFTTIGAGVEGRPAPPNQEEVFEVSPNPASGKGGISFTLGSGSECTATLTVYDISGRRMRTVLEGRLLAGINTVFWDGRDGNGCQAGPGCYLCLLRTKNRESCRRLVIIR